MQSRLNNNELDLDFSLDFKALFQVMSHPWNPPNNDQQCEHIDNNKITLLIKASKHDRVYCRLQKITCLPYSQ